MPILSQKQYAPLFSENKTLSQQMFRGFEEKAEEEKNVRAEKVREMIRNLSQNQTPQDRAHTFTGMSERSSKKDEEQQKTYSHYHFKEVEMKIQRAKNALSAAQAFLSAKRKVLEVKRKIASGKGDPEELQADLTHAKRMELVARKKKHHLELEELVENTQKQDEKKDAEEEAQTDLKNALIESEEEEITKREDEIFEERDEALEKALEEAREQQETFSEDEMAELGQMVSELGEEELEQLEKAMEAFEDLEVLDPHMSKEELEELKRKHRAQEQKAMIKADMDYLKEKISIQLEKGGGIPGLNFSVAGGFAMPEMQAQGFEISV